MKFKQVAPGQWEQPRRKNYLMKCCDCGLVHRMNFRIVKDKRGRSFIQMQAFRATREDIRKVANEKKQKSKKMIH